MDVRWELIGFLIIILSPQVDGYIICQQYGKGQCHTVELLAYQLIKTT